MSNLLNKMKTTKTIKSHEETIEPFGKILFVEPSRAHAKIINSFVKLGEMEMNEDTKSTKFKVDADKSDMAGQSVALVAFTMCDPETGKLVVEDEAHLVAVLDSTDAEGNRLHGPSVLATLAAAARRVTGADDKATQERAKRD